MAFSIGDSVVVDLNGLQVGSSKTGIGGQVIFGGPVDATVKNIEPGGYRVQLAKPAFGFDEVVVEESRLRHKRKAGPTVVKLLAAFILLAGPAVAGDKASNRERNELQQDICDSLTEYYSLDSELRGAPTDSNGNSLDPSTGHIEAQRETVSRRMSTLCQRYRERYGKPAQRCCDGQFLTPEERAAKLKEFHESERRQSAAEDAAHVFDKENAQRWPVDRKQPCEKFFATYNYWPSSCRDANLTPPIR